LLFKNSEFFMDVRWIKNIFAALALILTSMLLNSCVATYPFSEFETREIHHFERVKTGDTKQALLINGKDRSNPVLVYLHGGPGFPMLPFAPFSASKQELEKKFTIVYWEQRGTGKSFSKRLDGKSMNIMQFVEDTRQIIEYTRDLMGVEKVFLWGHSWGSNVGALYASLYPETLHAYFSTGQSVNPFANERLGYEFVEAKAKEHNNRRALRELQYIDTIPDNYTIEDALTLRKWVYRYGGIVYHNTEERPYVDWQEIKTILTTPVYSWGVRINLLLNPYYSIQQLWDDLREFDLMKEAPRIDVPVYFLVGRHDIIVSHKLAEKYFHHLEAPAGKELIWFEESAHRPFQEEPQKFMEVMKQIRQNHFPLLPDRNKNIPE